MSKLFLVLSMLTFSGCFSEESENSQAEVRNLEKASNSEDGRILRLKRVEDIPEYAKLSLESRYALVIGNNNYQNFTTLKNAVNDATDIGKKLEKIGFKVFKVLNGNRDEMNRKIQQFSNLLKKSGGVGMVFYAGHGLEMAGKNYLVPTDSNVKDKFDIPEENVALNTVLARLDEAGNRLNILVLDACRNDPVADGDFRETFGNSGLALPPSASGTYIAYSADIGQVAEDGKGRNGTFTKNLLENLDKEGVPLNKVFQLTRKAVEKDTDGDQSPASYDKTTGDFYFVLPKKKSIVIGERKEGETSIVTIGKKPNSESSVVISNGEAEDFRFRIFPYPADAKIEFINSKLKYSPEKFYKKGEYRLKISRKGYFPKEVEIYLDRNLESSINLDKSEFDLTILTNPIDAKIKIYGTQKRYENGVNLPKGDYKIEVSADRFHTKTAKINLTKDTLAEINLEQYLFSLTVNTYPKDSKIYIKYIPTKYRDGILLEGGKYKLKIKKSGYVSKLVEIDLRKDTDIDVQLLKVGETERSDIEISKSNLVWNGKSYDKSLSGATFDEVLKNLKLQKLGKYRNEKGNFSETFSFKSFSFPDFTFTKTLTPRDFEFETEGEFFSRKNKFEREREKAQDKWKRTRQIELAKYEHEKERAEINFQKRESAFQQKYRAEREKRISIIRREISSKRDEIFRSWLGKQDISIKYDPEKAQFSVHEKSFSLKFKFPVPRSEAKDFKKNLKNFDFVFEEKRGKLFLVGAKSGNFSTKLNIDFTKAKYIAENTVSVGNLMFQDFDLPKGMNWNSAVSYCENLELVGFSDWRLPNKKELKTARNNRNSFKNLRSKTSWYWSINKYNFYKSWDVRFSDGRDNRSDQTDNDFAVCVRDL